MNTTQKEYAAMTIKKIGATAGLWACLGFIPSANAKMIIDDRCPTELSKETIQTLKKNMDATVELKGADQGIRKFVLPIINERESFRKALPSSLNVLAKPFTLDTTVIKKTGTQEWLYCTFMRPGTISSKENRFSLVWAIEKLVYSR